MAVRIRQKALERINKYNSAPNKCKHCGNGILHKKGRLRETLIKKFCGHRCAMLSNEGVKEYNKNKRKKRRCCICNKELSAQRVRVNAIYCSRECWSKGPYFVSGKTKKEVSNRSIYNNALGKFQKIKKTCVYCGYKKFAEVHHIKPISKFLPTVLVSEINNCRNLALLCPNCHWEFAHGMIELRPLTDKVLAFNRRNGLDDKK